MAEQPRTITLQLTEDQYEYIKYCVDSMKRNREMALKAYYDKQGKLGKKPRQTRTTINLPKLQSVDLQQTIHTAEPPPQLLQLVIMKQPVQIP